MRCLKEDKVMLRFWIMLDLNKILYPTDFSEYSLAALPYAVGLVQQYHAVLHCLHVVDAPHEQHLTTAWGV